MALRVPCATDLSTRSNRVQLGATGSSGASRVLLNAEASEGAWRLVEIFGSVGAFEVEMAWSSGSGAGASAALTLARSGRVCVFARTLQIRAANLAAEQVVGVTVSDPNAYVRTENVLATAGQTVAVMGTDVTSSVVPRFAKSLTVPLRPTSGTATLSLFDAAGNALFTRLLSSLTDVPIPVGDAASAVINWGGAAQPRRFLFGLDL